ncbi:Heat shock protein HSP20/alpha crystallin family [Raphanus sativus]|nr:Heat shock protein HSP20/alpha crystallin family [Raphanus sativus]
MIVSTTSVLAFSLLTQDHPFVVKGRKRLDDSTQRKGDGSVCVSFNLPGVYGVDILVMPNQNEVKFYVENKEVYEHDESCHIFMGAVNCAYVFAHGVPLLSHDIAWDAEFGVLTVYKTNHMDT